MKGPTRQAPSVPGSGVTLYSPVTNWNNDPFGADVFEPNPQFTQKKKPPPRPPPPKVNAKSNDMPLKPSHFIRKPTVLSSLMSRNKNRTTVSNQSINVISHPSDADLHPELDTNKMFPKCDPKNVQIGTLIDFSSPPSSPTFTTRSSSDGLSVDSFGSDATTSTNHHNMINGGNASQAESGFEDDFELFLHSRKTIPKDDTLEDFSAVDPFSPQPQPVSKPPIMKKPSKDLFENMSNQLPAPSMKGPTIIRGKPARPKPPDNSALLKSTFGSSFPVMSMNVNTKTPIQKVCNGYGDSFEKPFRWDEQNSPERESSPPMPLIPPPPPPTVDEAPLEWPVAAGANTLSDSYADEPYGVALFDYFTDHPDDLCFSANSKIKLVRRVDDEWLYGKLRNGLEGIFPANYVEIKVPLPGEPLPPPARLGKALALYDFEPVQKGDLCFTAGDTISVISQLNDEWYFGECNGVKGQFPANYVQIS